MIFPVPTRTHDLISHWWHTVQDAVANLLLRCRPVEETAGAAVQAADAPRLPRAEAGAMSLAISIFEALVRRMLVVMSAGYVPAAPPDEGTRLLFRLDECPPTPAIRTPRAEAPDYCLKAPTEGRFPADRPTDGLVSAAPLLKRLAALAHVFEHGALYLHAMRARLQAPLKPLLAPQPNAFLDPALSPEQADNMQHLHEVALDAQSFDTS